MRALATWGVEEPALLEVVARGLPYGEGLAWQVYLENRPLFTERYAELPGTVPAVAGLDWRTFVAHPVPLLGAQRSRLVLVLGQRKARRWRRAEKELLAAAARAVGLRMERALESERYLRINRLFQTALLADLEAAYRQVLEEAVELVPGAEAGSLLVLEEGRYAFRAAVGYDLEALARVRFTPGGMLSWYGRGLEEALKNRPRLLSVQEVPLAEVSHRTAPPEVMDTAGRVREIQANLCLPIAHRGQVVAFLNLDNLHDPLAFGEDSLAVAGLLAGPLAVLLREVQSRRLLEEAALTDPLTGLPNRRAFERFFAEELARAQRYGHPLALLVMDLVGFKGINDRLGHQAGDQALVQVARALERECRGGDRIFRWGGDEFAALLPHTGREGARAAAQRYARAIGGLEVGGLRLGVNIGVAVYPEDGTDLDELLRRADDRMYRAKAEGIPVLADEGPS
jgi:diguanylate cyclase (GGDEF)-like protein